MKKIKIKLGRYSGFCFGVKRAVRLANQTLKNNADVFCLGPLIHNPQVVNDLSDRGLKIIKDLDKINDGTLIVRSHGLHPDLIDAAREKNIKLIDATCPFVKSAQQICQDLHKKGYFIVIVGDKDHPEVKALVGYAGKNSIVVDGKFKSKKFKLPAKKIGILAQTTQSNKLFLSIVSDFNGARVFNTICKDSIKRQEDAHRIAKTADIMLVLGSKLSANTRRLFQICQKSGTKIYQIERPGDLKDNWFNFVSTVGIATGASTPDILIKEVIKRIRNIRT